MSTKSDIPDTPPEVLARKPMALTQETARLLEKDEFMGNDGNMVRPNAMKEHNSSAIVDTMARAEEWAGPEPLRGLTVEQINEIKNREYTGAPKMLPQLGDRTPAYVNWLWQNYPHDAKVRYYPRGVWPTELPKEWPPKAALIGMDVASNPDKTVGAVVSQTGKVERIFTAAEVDAIMAGRPVEGYTPPAKPIQKRTYTKKAKPAATA